MSFMPFGKDDKDSDETNEDDSEWEWGSVVTSDGEPIEPGACEPYTGNKHKHRDTL